MLLLIFCNYLIKFAQSEDVFVWFNSDYEGVHDNEFFMCYIDMEQKFRKDLFHKFTNVLEDYGHTISHEGVSLGSYYKIFSMSCLQHIVL